MGSDISTYYHLIYYSIHSDSSWTPKEAVISIQKNNIYGLEIDDRAGQLASFAQKRESEEKKFQDYLRLGNENIKLNTISLKILKLYQSYTEEQLRMNNLK